VHKAWLLLVAMAVWACVSLVPVRPSADGTGRLMTAAPWIRLDDGAGTGKVVGRVFPKLDGGSQTEPTATSAAPTTSRAASTTTVPATTVSAPVPVGTLSDASRADADWILRAQGVDGAIFSHVDQQHVRPYLANFASIGLAAAARSSGNADYAAASWRWLAWYQAHMDGNGFVEDYDRVLGALVSTGDMDSTDAYAGTFLSAVRATFIVTGDVARLRSLQPGISAAVRAIELTQDVDGLTWAKPSYRVKYLMDQAETYAGLRSVAALAKTLADPALSTRATAAADRMEFAVHRSWNAAASSYDWAKHESGQWQQTDWSHLYSDSMQQIWAVAYGLADTSVRSTLVSTFLSAQPSWDLPTVMATYDSGQHLVGYWAPAAWAMQRVGRTDLAARAVERLRAGATTSNRAWPFTPSDAGQLIVADTGSLDLLLP
jgi:hypothetical protein